MGNTCTKARGNDVHEPVAKRRFSKLGKQRQSTTSRKDEADTVGEINSPLDKGNSTEAGQNSLGNHSRNGLEELKQLLQQIFNEQNPENYEDLLKQYFQMKISNPKLPTSIIEVSILVEHYKRGVTIYSGLTGDEICSLHPVIANEQHVVELYYYEGGNEVGHYNIDVKPEQTNYNCLINAYAKSMKLKKKKVQQDLYDKMKNSQEQYIKCVADILKSVQTTTALLSGEVNERTKVPQKTFKEIIQGNKRYTIYTAVNGIHVEAVREYEQILSVNRRGVLRSVNGKRESRLHTMKVKVTNLNFTTNVGRCVHTKPISGMSSTPQGNPEERKRRKDFCVSFHLAPSEAGANSANAYANGVMASRDLNEKERRIWTTLTDDGQTVKKRIGDQDFCVECEVEFEPLISNGNFDQFFDEINEARRNANQQEYHPTNKQAIKDRLQAMQNIDSRACRIKKLQYIVKVSGQVIYDSDLGSDYKLFIPDSFINPNQESKQPGDNFARNSERFNQNYIGKVPGRKRDQAHATQDDIVKFKQKLNEFIQNQQFEICEADKRTLEQQHYIHVQ